MAVPAARLEEELHVATAVASPLPRVRLVLKETSSPATAVALAQAGIAVPHVPPKVSGRRRQRKGVAAAALAEGRPAAEKAAPEGPAGAADAAVFKAC